MPARCAPIDAWRNIGTMSDAHVPTTMSHDAFLSSSDAAAEAAAVANASGVRATQLTDEAPPHSRSDDTVLFARLIAAREVRGELPLLGLLPSQLDALFARHFPWSTLTRDAANLALPPLLDAGHARFVVDMRTLLLDHAATEPLADDAYCIASIVAHACLRPDHLWRDLGLDGRDDVTRMLTRYFPSLVARNTEGLRWKKFLARELALAQGAAPGPSPGCPACEDFGFCFGNAAAPHDAAPSR
jgi:nitrogen fixation protein NifQ